MSNIDTLYRFGWRKISSDIHAYHLIRREIKHHKRFQPVYKDYWDYNRLLMIKKGNLYKILKNKNNSYTGILLRVPSNTTSSPR